MGKRRDFSKRFVSALLSASMVFTGITFTPKDTSAAETQQEPWLLSEGRPAYGSTTNGGDKAIFATDGMMNRHWQATAVEPGKPNNGEWLDVDLGASADISSVEINWLGDNEYAAAYTILVSDDEVNWKEVYKVDNGTGGQGYEVYEEGEDKTPVEYAVVKDGDEWKAKDPAQQAKLDAYKAAGQNRAYMIFREQIKDFTADVTGRYIRVKTTMSAGQAKNQDHSGYGVGIREIKIYGVGGVNSPTSNDVNIAPGHPTKASTEVVDWAIMRPASGAFDGRDSTYWKSKEGNDEWVQVDLEKVYTIGRMTIEWVAEFGRIYDIQTSLDGENWTTVYRQLHGIGEKEEINMYQKARYVKMKGYAMGRGSGYTVKELQIFEWKEGDSKENPLVEPLPERQVVEVGEGSYIIDDMGLRQPRAPYYVTDNVSTPIQSNDWWSSVLYQRLSDAIVPLPYALQYTDTGLGLYYANEQYITQSSDWGASGVIGSGSEQFDLTINTSEIKHTPSSRVDKYDDWSVDIVWSDDDTPKQKTTLIKGSPFIYNTFTNPSEVEVSAYKFIKIFDAQGNSILAKDGDSVTADHIGMVLGNLSKGAPDLNDRENKEQIHNLGLFMPEGTKITRIGSKLKIELGSNQNYLTVGVFDDGDASLTDKLAYMYQYAYTYVTDTIVTYNYDDATSYVTTNYECVVEQKRTGDGIKNETLMCLFPHQWRNVEANVAREDKTYSSARGKLKIHEGNNFSYSLRFTGLIPAFSKPDLSAEEEELMREYLNSFAQSTISNYWIADPYWQGKKTHPMALGILIAEQLGEYEIRDMLIKNLRKVMENWLSYDGEDDFPYHMYYSESWGTLNGNGGDFGMAMNLTDHHFVWAYFIYPAAVLASYDPTFVEEYGDMLEMLIRDCMNPDKEDELFPFMRNFDPYEGHSWAGGYCDNPDGNNQESAGEATFAWAGLYLWGLVTGNDEYRDAGIWGWTSESNAVLEYWFDVHDDIWMDKYKEGCVGMVFGLTYNNGTYFGVNPSSIFGIHLLPVTPAQSYMGYNQEYAANIYSKYREAQDRYQKYLANKGTPDYDPEGWYHIMLPFLSLTDSDAALKKWNEEWNKVDGAGQHTSNLAKERDELYSSYWYLQNMNSKGQFTDEIWASNYTSYQVFKKGNKYTASVWNPSDKPIEVEFHNAAGKTATVTVAANALVDVDPTKDGSYGEEAPPADLYEDVYGVPGFIDAGDYAANYTCALVDGQDPEEGTVVGAIKNNSALTYNIDVEEAGEYVIEYRLKTVRYTDDGKLRAKTDLSDEDISVVPVKIDDTSFDADNWQTDKGTIQLQKGEQELKIIFNAESTISEALKQKEGKEEIFHDEINLSWIRIYKAGTTPPVAADTGLSTDLTGLSKISLEGATAEATSVDGSDKSADKAIDGDTSTRWNSNPEDPQTLTITLAEKTDIGGIKLIWENAAAKTYTVDVSEDGQKWKTVYSRTDGKQAEEASVKFDSVYSVKYVRMSGTERVGGYGYSIYEIELYGKGDDQRALLETPVLTAVKDGDSAVKLNWNAVDNAKEYKIYRALSTKAVKKEIKTTTDTTYTDANLTEGTYYYWVVASPGTSDTYGDSKYSENVAGIHISTSGVPLEKVTAQAEKQGNNAVKISWSAAANAEAYEIYRTTGIFAKVRIARVTDLSYVDEDLTAGKYSYRVVAIPAENSGYERSDYSTVTSTIQINEQIAAPVLTATKSGDDAIALKWDAVEKAESYRVYRSAQADGEKAFLTSVQNNGYTDMGLANGTWYYWVVAIPQISDYLQSDYSADIAGVVLDNSSVKAVEAQSITLNTSAEELKVGKKIKLTAYVEPSNVTDTSIIWLSDDTTVASVDAGVVTAIGAGEAVITAKTANGKEATCTITVKESDNNSGGSNEKVKVTKVTLSQPTATLKVGETLTLTATVEPEDATDKTISWSTSNPNVAEVKNGTVTAVAEGTTDIKATASNGKAAICKVTVTKEDGSGTNPGVTGEVTITLDSESGEVKIGETITVNATVTPAGTEVTWNSSDETVAAVDNGVITGKKVGYAIITATAGEKEAFYVVTVTDENGKIPDGVNAQVAAIVLRPSKAALKVGGTVTLTTTIAPINAVDKTITWDTSDPDVATVNDGTVLAKAAGTATITAIAASGVKAECIVTVTNDPQNPGNNDDPQNPGNNDDTQNPGNNDTQNPGENDTQNPGENDTQNPGGNDTQNPGGNDTQNPGDNNTQTPGNNDTQTPGSGTTQTGEQLTVSKVSVAAESRPYGIKTIYLKKNARLKLKATVTGSEGIDTRVTYTSDKNIVSVTDGQIKAGKKTGTAVITVASVLDPTKNTTITVKVVAKATPNKVLKLKKTKLSLKAKGEQAQIQLKKYTKTTTDTVSYKVVSGKKYVKVDKYGVITSKANPGKKALTAKVQVTCGSKKAVVTVTIPKKK